MLPKCPSFTGAANCTVGFLKANFGVGGRELHVGI